MGKRIVALLQDDWELAGNGDFHVASHQYLPALFLMNLAEELGIRLTFTVEACQQLAFLRLAGADPEIAVQSRLWEDCVRLMKIRGFDVQLHVHPHWDEGVFTGKQFLLGRNWNLATYPQTQRRRILDQCIRYLEGLLRPIDENYRVCAFKAGSWGLQPSEGLLGDLEDRGIELVLGLGKGLCLQTPEFCADYRNLEEDTLPYCPDPADVCRVSARPQALAVVPLSWWKATPGLWRHKLRSRLSLWLRSGRSLDAHKLDAMLFPQRPRRSERSPLVAWRSKTLQARLQRLTGGHLAHLALEGGCPVPVMKRALDQIVQRLCARPEHTVPLVIETHSKSYWAGWTGVREFLCYLVGRYGKLVEFQTLSQFRDSLRAGEAPLRGQWSAAGRGEQSPSCIRRSQNAPAAAGGSR